MDCKKMYIGFEGTDGSGKSSLYDIFALLLKLKGFKVLKTREFGSSIALPYNVTEIFKDFALNSRYDFPEELREMCFACCSILNNKLVKDVASDYDIILTDRSWVSNIAYGSRNTPFATEIYSKMYDCDSLLWEFPDIIFWIDTPVEIAYKRSSSAKTSFEGGEDHIEAKGLEFQREVYNEYARLCLANDSIYRIDGMLEPEDRLQIMLELFENKNKEKNNVN